MRKCANIKSYLNRLFVINDFAPNPFWFPNIWRKFSFLSLSAQLKTLEGSGAKRQERGDPWRLLKLRHMGTQGVHMKGVLPWLVNWARCTGNRDFCPALTALVSPVQNIFFLSEVRYAVLYLVNFYPSSSKLGRQSCQVARLLMWGSVGGGEAVRKSGDVWKRGVHYTLTHHSRVVCLSPLPYNFKGTVSWDGFQKFWLKFKELGLTKGRGWFLNFLGAPMIL